MDTSKQILKHISHKIHYERKDNLLNHLKTYFQLDQINYSGICKNNNFVIWRYSPWSGLFYIVLEGQVVTDNENTTVTLKTKPNSAGLLLTIFIFLSFFFGLFEFRLETFTAYYIFFRLAFASLPILAIGLGYLNQRKKCLSDIREMINNNGYASPVLVTLLNQQTKPSLPSLR